MTPPAPRRQKTRDCKKGFYRRCVRFRPSPLCSSPRCIQEQIAYPSTHRCMGYQSPFACECLLARVGAVAEDVIGSWTAKFLRQVDSCGRFRREKSKCYAYKGSKSFRAHRDTKKTGCDSRDRERFLYTHQRNFERMRMRMRGCTCVLRHNIITRRMLCILGRA